MRQTKTDAEMTDAERAARKAQLAAVRAQILHDQATGAKRDPEPAEHDALRRQWGKE